MKATNNHVIDQFILETALISPIEKIILQFENSEFRDCDIKWLDSKLENFMCFAARTLGISGIVQSDLHPEKFVILNNYALTYYKKRFNTLLLYFKNFL